MDIKMIKIIAMRPFSENMFRILSITYSGVTSFDQKYYRDLLSSRRDKSGSLYITNEGQWEKLN